VIDRFTSFWEKGQVGMPNWHCFVHWNFM
jgi:hypothetical protein